MLPLPIRSTLWMWCGALVLGATSASFVTLARAALDGEKTAASEKSVAGFSSETIDVGLCVSNIDASIDFYTKAIGFKELPGFGVNGEYAIDTGLSDGQPLDVRVLTLGDGPGATKLKLMQFPKAPGARVDQSYIQSSYGIRYLTIHVNDVNAALETLKSQKVKSIAKTPLLLPKGFPEGIALCNVRDPDGNLVELVGPYQP